MRAVSRGRSNAAAGRERGREQRNGETRETNADKGERTRQNKETKRGEGGRGNPEKSHGEAPRLTKAPEALDTLGLDAW